MPQNYESLVLVVNMAKTKTFSIHMIRLVYDLNFCVKKMRL